MDKDELRKLDGTPVTITAQWTGTLSWLSSTEQLYVLRDNGNRLSPYLLPSEVTSAEVTLPAYWPPQDGDVWKLNGTLYICGQANNGRWLLMPNALMRNPVLAESFADGVVPPGWELIHKGAPRLQAELEGKT